MHSPAWKPEPGDQQRQREIARQSDDDDGASNGHRPSTQTPAEREQCRREGQHDKPSPVAEQLETANSAGGEECGQGSQCRERDEDSERPFDSLGERCAMTRQQLAGIKRRELQQEHVRHDRPLVQVQVMEPEQHFRRQRRGDHRDLAQERSLLRGERYIPSRGPRKMGSEPPAGCGSEQEHGDGDVAREMHRACQQHCDCGNQDEIEEERAYVDPELPSLLLRRLAVTSQADADGKHHRDQIDRDQNATGDRSKAVEERGHARALWRLAALPPCAGGPRCRSRSPY